MCRGTGVVYSQRADCSYQCLNCGGVGKANIPEAEPQVSLGARVRHEISGRHGMVVADRIDRLVERPIKEFLVSFVDGFEAWFAESDLDLAEEDSLSLCSPLASSKAPVASSKAWRKTSKTSDGRALLRSSSPSSPSSVASDRASIDSFVWDDEMPTRREHRTQHTSPKMDSLLSVAKAEIKRGMALEDAAHMLHIKVAVLRASLAQEGPATMAVGALNSNWQERLDMLIEEDPELCCPVSLEMFIDPVIASDGFTYEKASLECLLRTCMASPMTREELKREYLPSPHMRRDAIHVRETRSQELLNFAKEALAPQPRMATAALKQASEYIECLGTKQVPSLAEQAAALWQRLGQPVPQGWSV